MNTSDIQLRILPGGQGVAFTIVWRGNNAECVVTREALEQHFWLEPNAPDERAIRIFLDGYKRLCAVAERKLLARHDSHVTVTAEDFRR